MTPILRRIAKLEGTRPAPTPALVLDLPPDLAQRIRAAQAAGTFPASLGTGDLAAILDAAKARGGGHG